MPRNLSVRSVEDGSRGLPAHYANHIHANEIHAPRPILIDWLEGTKNWPDHAEHLLEDFMVNNTFFSYKSTKNDSRQKLDRVVRELQNLFDPADWDEQIHFDKLKEKVCNKIHRIRAKRNRLPKFLKDLEKLPNEAYPEAVRKMVKVFGKEKVSAGLAEVNLEEPNVEEPNGEEMNVEEMNVEEMNMGGMDWGEDWGEDLGDHDAFGDA